MKICFLIPKKLYLNKLIIMNNKLLGIVLIACTLLMACHKKEISKKAIPIITAEQNTKKAIVKDVIIDKELDIVNTGSPISIDSAQIHGNEISFFVNYSGGCKEHTFELYSNGNYSKSLPPQLSVFLKHNNNEDNCRELISRELIFNITKLKYQGKNTVVLKFGDKKQIKYTY